MSSQLGFQVTVHTVDGGTLLLRVQADSGIASCKAMIEERTGIPTHQQRLVCEGQLLELDGCWETFADFNIYGDCSLGLVRVSWFMLHVVTLQHPTCDFLIMDVMGMEKVSDVKARICAVKGVPLEQQHLYQSIWDFINGTPINEELQDDMALSICGLSSEKCEILLHWVQ